MNSSFDSVRHSCPVLPPSCQVQLLTRTALTVSWHGNAIPFWKGAGRRTKRSSGEANGKPFASRTDGSAQLPIYTVNHTASPSPLERIGNSYCMTFLPCQSRPSSSAKAVRRSTMPIRLLYLWLFVAEFSNNCKDQLPKHWTSWSLAISEKTKQQQLL